jgi:hypothetical protein
MLFEEKGSKGLHASNPNPQEFLFIYFLKKGKNISYNSMQTYLYNIWAHSF